MLRAAYIHTAAAAIVDQRLAGSRRCRAGRYRHRSRLELAHRCRNSADNRVGGTLSDHVRIGSVHDGTRPSGSIRAALSGACRAADANRPAPLAMSRNIRMLLAGPVSAIVAGVAGLV